ncbi:olfactory receptor 6K3-like [Solea senegalensis]|uniref:Olfactory receptor 6K3-like n=1 Tax=Solea senegalensis TaxID=28829 RepID=A0AAV6PL21_SOLSE|nr:olfactory receptor 6K3-like [Solea senegalensis]
MWTNSSMNPLYFEFTLFSDLGPLRYVFFCVCVCIYATIVCVNAAIVLSVSSHRSLHRPMYVFICSLSLNSLYGSAAFFPRFLCDLVSDAHFISRPSCFLQMYVIHSYKGQEVTILTVMAYDRFVAIFHPLHYQSKMSMSVVGSLLVLAVLYPVAVFGFFFYSSSRLPLCGHELRRLFCNNWSIVQLSCVETVTINKSSQFFIVMSIFVPLFFVLYTYLRVLLLCRRSSSEFRRKALHTCLPHIVTFLNFCVTVFCEVLLSLYRVDQVNVFVVAVLSLEFLLFPPITNPLVYGLSLPQIRAVAFRRVRIHARVPAKNLTNPH